MLFKSLQSCAFTNFAKQFQQFGYVEICDTQHIASTYDALYASFDLFVEFLQQHPTLIQKLYIAKERFIRSKFKNYYGTDFFGLYDESAKIGRNQISFYYSTCFHEFLSALYPEFNQIVECFNFFNACYRIQKECSSTFQSVANELKFGDIFSSEYHQVPIIFKVVKYLPSYRATRPHYDGTVFSLLLDSTDNASLLLAAYKSFFTIHDFVNPIRTFVRNQNQNSILLIPGTLVTEFGFYPTPHIVIHSGKVRYATIAFAMRPNYISTKNNFTILPNF